MLDAAALLGKPPDGPLARYAGEDMPAGQAAVGWRVGVYWNNDTLFYYGDIIQHEPHTNRCDTIAVRKY